jgi:hypothetical protein
VHQREHPAQQQQVVARQSARYSMHAANVPLSGSCCVVDLNPQHHPDISCQAQHSTVPARLG